MSDYSLVPVDYQPEFEGVSLVPVDYNPFSTDGVTRQAAAPQLAPSVAPSDDYNGQSGAQLPKFADGSSAYNYTSLAPSLNDDPKADGPYWPKSSKTGSNQQQFSMASHAAYSRCVDKCLHLLPSPSGDLQSSEFRLCVAQCMGRL
jgi:hypothetical protein